jgi:hypothetical protein
MTLQYCRTVATVMWIHWKLVWKHMKLLQFPIVWWFFFFVFLIGHLSFHLKMQYSTGFSHKCSECALPFLFNSQVKEHRKVYAKVIKYAVRASSGPWRSICRCTLICFSSYSMAFCLKHHKRVHSSGIIVDLYQGFAENVSWHLQCCIHLKCKWAFILEKSF